MKSQELIKLRYDIIKLLQEHGTNKDRENIFDRTREYINFITTGSRIKKPVVKG